jgi:hypothetical protein
LTLGKRRLDARFNVEGSPMSPTPTRRLLASISCPLRCALFATLVMPLPATPAGDRITGAVAPIPARATATAPRLTVVPCNGSLVALNPGTPPTHTNSSNVDVQRGMFVTALKNLQLCAMGIKLTLGSPPHTLTAYLYEADHLTRGALLATASVTISGGPQVHFVPINYTLQACQDYEIVFNVPANDTWEWWDTHVTPIPFDVQGTVRVRYPGGSEPVTFALPNIQLLGSPLPTAVSITDFAGPGAPNPAGDPGQDRGVFIRMLDTSRLCSFGFQADIPAGQMLTATVYNATGTVRESAIATGTYTVQSAGLQWHDVSLNALLVEGNNYDLAVQWSAMNQWPWWDEQTFAEPFTRDVFEVVGAEANGDVSNFALPHFQAKWEEHVGVPFNLTKQGETPNQSTQAYGEYGMLVTALVRERVSSVGWRADVAAGQTISATIYRATGTTRTSTLATGSITSSGDGMRWHDIPLAAELQAGDDYDISIYFNGANRWHYWSDLTAMPYTPYGVIQVRDGEYFADPSNTELLEIRVNGCNTTLTPVSDRPARTPMLLVAPAPNPISGVSRVDFSLDEAGPVTLHVYDAAGRLVSTVMDAHAATGWNSAQLDSKRLASGVYFLKLATARGAVTRKFVVVH